MGVMARGYRRVGVTVKTPLDKTDAPVFTVLVCAGLPNTTLKHKRQEHVKDLLKFYKDSPLCGNDEKKSERCIFKTFKF